MVPFSRQEGAAHVSAATKGIVYSVMVRRFLCSEQSVLLAAPCRGMMFTPVFNCLRQFYKTGVDVQISLPY